MTQRRARLPAHAKSPRAGIVSSTWGAVLRLRVGLPTGGKVRVWWGDLVGVVEVTVVGG